MEEKLVLILNEMAEYLKSVNLDTLAANATAAGVPEELVSQIKDILESAITSASEPQENAATDDSSATEVRGCGSRVRQPQRGGKAGVRDAADADRIDTRPRGGIARRHLHAIEQGRFPDARGRGVPRLGVAFRRGSSQARRGSSAACGSSGCPTR